MIVFLAVLLVFWLFLPSKIFAAQINLSNPNLETVNDFNQEYQLDVSLSISAQDETKYYLRGVFYKPGTNKYCGITANGDNWYKGPFSANDGWKNLPVISISSNSGQIRLKVKFDKDDNDCNSSGEYNFKVQRFTGKGSTFFDDQNEQKIIAVLPDFSPTAKPVSTKSPTLTLTARLKSDASPSKPSNTPQPTQTLKVQNLPTGVSTAASAYSVMIQNQASKSSATSDTATVNGITRNVNNNFILLPLFSGIVMVFSAAILAFNKMPKFKI